MKNLKNYCTRTCSSYQVATVQGSRSVDYKYVVVLVSNKSPVSNHFKSS